jgi:hypothetical protein
MKSKFTVPAFREYLFLFHLRPTINSILLYLVSQLLAQELFNLPEPVPQYSIILARTTVDIYVFSLLEIISTLPYYLVSAQLIELHDMKM